MERKIIIENLKKVAQNRKVNINFDTANLNATLKELGIDSLEAMGIIVDTENALKVRVPDESLAEMKTLGHLIDMFVKVAK
ncbi:MAG: phosphopantetheine-binding protein [Mycoplasmataceae bacterium]|jgi:acyl carrier protein|nr:phosphopantetheine-binding protein [Mycoplasmataceae bacterium]